MLNIKFISIDANALKIMQQTASGFASIERADFDLPLLDKQKNYDAIIIDFRNNLPPQAQATYSCFSDSKPYIAMIDVCGEKRRKVFELGYSDYFFWPIIGHELEQRLQAIINAAKSSLGLFSRDARIERCCRYMLEHLEGKIKLPKLCQLMGTNQTSLTRKFVKEFGVSPMTWLRDQRLRKASQLLLRTDDSVLAIAQKCGYDDSNNFSTAFRSKFDESPSQFRKSKK